MHLSQINSEIHIRSVSVITWLKLRSAQHILAMPKAKKQKVYRQKLAAVARKRRCEGGESTSESGPETDADFTPGKGN